MAKSRRILHAGAVIVAVVSAALVLGACSRDIIGPDSNVAKIKEQSQGNKFGDFAEVESFTGQVLTFSATVGKVVSPNAFTVVDRSGDTLLVLYDGTPPTPNAGTGVTVSGTATASFAVDEAQAFAGGGLDDAAFESFTGEPYIQAETIDPAASFPNGRG